MLAENTLPSGPRAARAAMPDYGMPRFNEQGPVTRAAAVTRGRMLLGDLGDLGECGECGELGECVPAAAEENCPGGLHV